MINTHLIGHLSKNYTNGNDKLISGDLLIELAFERIKEKNMYERFFSPLYNTNSDNRNCDILAIMIVVVNMLKFNSNIFGR